MDISSLSPILDMISEFSFKDAISLAIIGYQFILGRSQEAQPTDMPEISDLTTEETTISSHQSSLFSIAKDNGKNKLKSLIQKARQLLKRKAKIGMKKVSIK